MCIETFYLYSGFIALPYNSLSVVGIRTDSGRRTTGSLKPKVIFITIDDAVPKKSPKLFINQLF